jgi:hypothetical protein
MIRYRIDPRDLPPEKVARRLHLTKERFEELLPNLRARGFPAADPTTGNFDGKAIEAWMDQRSGLSLDLTSAKPARNAEEVFGDRARRILHGQ